MCVCGGGGGGRGLKMLNIVRQCDSFLCARYLSTQVMKFVSDSPAFTHQKNP